MGPIVAGSIVYTTNFFVLNILIFISNIAYAPVLYILRNFYAYKPMESDELTSFAHQPLHNEPDNDNYPRLVANNNYNNSSVFDSSASTNAWSKSAGPMGIDRKSVV